MKKLVFLFLIFNIAGSAVFAQVSPRVLVVVAHPDDESILSVTLYKLAKEQHATVDLFVITNGEAGYRYSTLAEQYYGCTLTNAEDARKNLPAIRRKELREAGKILGIAHEYFGNQPDSHFSINEREPLDTSWHVSVVKKQLNELLTHHHYDMVLCLLPEADTHAGHKAATILALEAVAALPAQARPVILGAALHDKTDAPSQFDELSNYNLTRTTAGQPAFVVDRTVSFSYKNKINYKVIANWELAAHKSQGATQMTMNDGDLEEFWYFELNAPDGQTTATHLFAQLNQMPYGNNGQSSGRLVSQSYNEKQ
jgi:LmbE family N-acetylglucosaminyl deacetylase